MTNYRSSDYLLANQLAELIEIDPDYSDTALYCQRYELPLEQALNSILVSTKVGQNRKLTLMLVPATMKLENRALKQGLGGRTSFAPADIALAATGMEYGGITPIGLTTDIPIAGDPSVLTEDSYVLGAGPRDKKYRLQRQAVLKLIDIETPGVCVPL